jgi:hypothetical protein
MSTNKKKASTTRRQTITISPSRLGPNSANGGGLPLLTPDDIFRGGDTPSFSSAEVPGLLKGDRPGVVLYRQTSAGVMLKFLEMNEAEGVSVKEQIETSVNLLEQALVNPDGTQLMTREQLLRVPFDTLTRIVEAIAFRARGEVDAGGSENDTATQPEDGQGNAMGEVVDSADADLADPADEPQPNGAASPTN